MKKWNERKGQIGIVDREVRFGKRKVKGNSSKVEKLVRESGVRLLVEMSSRQEGQLVSILTWSRDTNGTHPVEVSVTQLVGQLLECVWLQGCQVTNDVVVGWRNGSLS